MKVKEGKQTKDSTVRRKKKNTKIWKYMKV
jgi:hypothetical protein